MMPGQSASKLMRWLEGKIVYSVGFGVVLMLAVGAGLFYFYGRTPPKVVRIAYGSGGPLRTHFVQQLAKHGQARNLDIRLVVTEGADETLDLIDRKEADLALITGALDDSKGRPVFEVAPLYMEPLQLLVREPLYDAVSKDFGTLAGRTIAIDDPDTATNILATELLAFIGLADPITGEPHYRAILTPRAQYPQIKDADLPDAILQIGGLPSPAIRRLIVDRHYRLVALPFGDSFSLEKFRAEDAPKLQTHTTLSLDRGFVEEAVIPEFSYSVLPAVPPSDTRTIATRLVLIGRPLLDDMVVHQILELLVSPEISSLVKPPLTLDLFNSPYQFPRHHGTIKYLASLQPINIDSAFDAYGRVVEVWGIIITIYIGGASYLKSWRQKRAQLEKASVGDFLQQVMVIESEAVPACSHDDRINLDQRLSDIKKHVIDLHLDDRLEDSEHLQWLLSTIADARTRIWGSAS